MKTRSLIQVLAAILCSSALAPATETPLNSPLAFRERLKGRLDADNNRHSQFKTQAGSFTQRLNWDDLTDTRTFQNRYFVNSEFATGPDAPVIYYAGAEVALGAYPFEQDYVGVLARALGAHYVSLENRYYGTSQPFPQLTGENMKYLNLRSVLADLAAFQKYWTKKNQLTGKWIIWGGSYGGAVAAYYRLKYPELVAGALSSSGAVNLQLMDNQVDSAAAQNVGLECTHNFRQKILEPVERAMAHSAELKKFKQAFDAEKLTDDQEFLAAIGGTADFVEQEEGPKTFCQTVQNPLSAGESLQSFLTLMNKLFKSYSTSFLGMTSAGVEDPDAKLYSQGLGLRQWNYQSCTELGGWSGPGPDADHALSSLRPDYYQLNLQICHKLFGKADIENIHKTNTLYYKPLLDPKSASRILFVNGSADPILTTSISPVLGNATNPNFVYVTVDGGSHCQDMDTPSDQDSASLRTAREIELQTVRGWIQDN